MPVLSIGIRRNIRFNLVGVGQAVCAVKYIDHSNDLRDCLIIKT